MAYNMFNPQNYFGQQQQSQQMYPQPNGNVFLVNSSLEAANIPVGLGTTVAISLNDNLMYLKNAANGVPNTLAYKLVPYNEPPQKIAAPQSNENSLEQRMTTMEQQLAQLIEALKPPTPNRESKKEPIPWDA